MELTDYQEVATLIKVAMTAGGRVLVPRHLSGTYRTDVRTPSS